MQVTEDVELISIREAAKRFGLTRTAINDAMNRGDIQRYERELGRERVFVDAKEIERKLKPRPTTERGSNEK